MNSEVQARVRPMPLCLLLYGVGNICITMVSTHGYSTLILGNIQEKMTEWKLDECLRASCVEDWQRFYFDFYWRVGCMGLTLWWKHCYIFNRFIQNYILNDCNTNLTMQLTQIWNHTSETKNWEIERKK